MTETQTTGLKKNIDEYGVIGPVAVAIVAGVVYYGVHEVFHMLLGVGFTVDAVGSAALGLVAAAGVYALGRNVRAAVASFIGLVVTHTLVMGHGGALAISGFSWSLPIGIAGALVFFLAAGGLEE